jgi:3-oxoacyl-(acyl-carrier-protein) synthase III
MRACVGGWGTAVPEKLVTNAEMEQRVDTTDAWIVERTGIRERHVAAATDTTASIAIDAGTAAIKHAGIPPDAIDLLIVATASPEQPIPHTGAFVGEGLGLRCGSFDLGAGCAGFVYMLVVGSSLLATGNLDHVLIVGAEILSRLIDPTTGRRPSSSATVPLRPSSAALPMTGPASSPGTSGATARRPDCSRSAPVAAACRRRRRPSPPASST